MDSLYNKSLLRRQLDCKCVCLGNRWADEAVDAWVLQHSKRAVVVSNPHLCVVFEARHLQDLVSDELEIVYQMRRKQCFLHRDEADAV